MCRTHLEVYQGCEHVERSSIVNCWLAWFAGQTCAYVWHQSNKIQDSGKQLCSNCEIWQPRYEVQKKKRQDRTAKEEYEYMQEKLLRAKNARDAREMEKAKKADKEKVKNERNGKEKPEVGKGEEAEEDLIAS